LGAESAAREYIVYRYAENRRTIVWLPLRDESSV